MDQAHREAKDTIHRQRDKVSFILFVFRLLFRCLDCKLKEKTRWTSTNEWESIRRPEVCLLFFILVLLLHLFSVEISKSSSQRFNHRQRRLSVSQKSCSPSDRRNRMHPVYFLLFFVSALLYFIIRNNNNNTLSFPPSLPLPSLSLSLCIYLYIPLSSSNPTETGAHRGTA